MVLAGCIATSGAVVPARMVDDALRYTTVVPGIRSVIEAFVEGGT